MEEQGTRGVFQVVNSGCTINEKGPLLRVRNLWDGVSSIFLVQHSNGMTPALQKADLAGQGRFVYNGWLQIPFWVQKLLWNTSTELSPVEQLRDASPVAHSRTKYHLLGKCILRCREDGVRARTVTEFFSHPQHPALSSSHPAKG